LAVARVWGFAVVRQGPGGFAFGVISRSGHKQKDDRRGNVNR
jgi:hypothetical protein